MTDNYDTIRPISWRDGKLFLLDQRVLPQEYIELELNDAEQVADAIRDMVVRGAPAIGITAADGKTGLTGASDGEAFIDSKLTASQGDGARDSEVYLVTSCGVCNRPTERTDTAVVEISHRDRICHRRVCWHHYRR